MARAPSKFRMRDVTKAVKAVRAAGEGVARVEVDQTGKIIVITGADADAAKQPNEWDDVK